MNFNTIFFFLLAFCLQIVSAAPSALSIKRSPDPIPNALASAFLGSNAPIFYRGPRENFPAMDTWMNFGDMFNANTASMVAAGSTWDDVGRMRVAIQDAAAAFGVDERVILGIIMEESTGYVGVVTTWNVDGQATAGLMQASGCPGYPGQTNLHQADISSMVNCGTQHYQQNLQHWSNLGPAQAVYPALREYNSGSVDINDLSVAPNGAGNPFYVSDISQRFQGWTN
ncbi:hypothetical protein SLS53_005756 [Cytospora paraplurivora]|uniref:Transglycosylase SLT domain-containing protein n=1 Tax=Cytospora paraplurivora TaxID=2898453 RepID=A0AAN9YFS5_9PEZI